MPPKTTERPLKPFKFVGSPVFIVENERGEIVREVMLRGEVAIYAPDFGDLENIVAKLVPEAQAAYQQQQNGSG